MIIDFHTHIFPDRIAENALKSLLNGMKENAGKVYPLFGDGTLDNLRDHMKKTGVDKSIVMPIATRAGQTDNINSFAESIRSGDVISFGSVYPYQDDVEKVLYDLCMRGFKGIKLHPEFQQFDIDSKLSINILKECEKLGLIVLLHAGKDPGVSGKIHCTPHKLYNALQEVSGKKIIAAHLGGLWMWDEVCKYLIGTNIYMDIACVGPFIDKFLYKSIITGHGADKILFASDFPWESPADTLKALESLQLADEDMELITYKNALNLLDI